MKIIKSLLILLLIITSSFSNIETNKFHFGVVTYYSEDKNFGYIVDDKTKDELFFYFNNQHDDLINEVKKGSYVFYLIRDTRKGLNAYEIRLNKNQ